MIVVTLLEPSLAALKAAVVEFDGIADAYEVRLDALAGPVAPADLARLAGKPILVACRRPADAGTWRGPEGERLATLAACHAVGLGPIDVEGDTAIDVPEDRLVRSIHDLEGTTSASAMAPRLRALAAGGALVKYAARVQDFADTLELLALCRLLHADGIRFAVMGLGDFPRPLAHLMGATYVYGGGRKTAPHQPSARALVATLDHWGRPGPAGALYLVVGSPVDHSLSPRMHNAAFAAAGIDAAYGALAVPTHRDLARLLRRAPALGLAGLSVTAPLKESAYRLCATRTPEAEQAQSVNTIRIGPEGAAGHNTDGMAALDIVANRLAQGRTIRGVLIVGSGGAARGLAGALASRYNVTLAARNTEARNEIGRRLDVRTLSLDEAAKDPAFDLLVNATSHDEPISLNGRDAALLDLRYGADPTPWQRHAHEHGLPFAGGREILWAQGVHAFHHWTGQEAPARLMAQALGVTP